MDRVLSRAWLVFGLFQMVSVADVSHVRAAENDHLFSSKAKVVKSDLADTNDDAPRPMPVRIPRTFFEQSLEGRLNVDSDHSGFKLDLSSPVVWNQEPTQLPAPQPGAIADFRDFTGCANYHNIDSVAVCFNVMPDVSSVGVNAKDVSLRNMESYIASELNVSQSGTQYEVSNVQFRDAKRAGGQVTIGFTGDANPTSNPNAEKIQLKIQLKLQSAAATF